MPRRLNLPDTSSIANPGEGGRLHAPSAERNAAAICSLVADHAPKEGRALEIASGTGQHVVALAQSSPGLIWQPSDIDAARRASIDAWAQDSNLSNIAPAIELDATTAGWAKSRSDWDLILLVNLLHLISEPEARVLIREVAQALIPGGRFILYGPFLRDGETTSEGDTRFHASLQAQDPEIGYKDVWEVIDWMHEAGLELVEFVEMPANNLAFVARRSA